MRGVVLAFTGAVYAAGGSASSGASSGAKEKSDVSAVDAGKPRTFENLDADNDGSIGMTEAAADANAKQNFKQIDKNNDFKISRQEWEAAMGFGSGAATGSGATTGGSTGGGASARGNGGTGAGSDAAAEKK